MRDSHLVVNKKNKISYNKDLPANPKDYLKVKGMPKIIFVNGHWNRIANKIGMSPGSGGLEYWKFFNSKIENYFKDANKYFNLSLSKIEYIDGSSFIGGDENGEERKNRGYKYANDNFEKLVKGLGNESIYLISHSEGGACATGVAKLLIEKGIKIGQSLMLSNDEGDEFQIEENYECYQITAGYLIEDKISKKNIFHVDPVVLDNKIKGINKYGIFISQNSDFFTVHGSTISSNIFRLTEVIKSIHVQKALNSKGNTVYVTNPVDDNWYRIDDYILYNKRIDLYPKLNTSLVEYLEERED